MKLGSVRGQGSGVRRKFWLLALLAWHFCLLPLTAHPEISSLYSKILELSRARYRDINSSVVKGLPSYANRTPTRSSNRTADVYSTSRTPRVLTLGPGEYPRPWSAAAPAGIYHNLERQYTAGNRLNYSNTTGCFDSNPAGWHCNNVFSLVPTQDDLYATGIVVKALCPGIRTFT